MGFLQRVPARGLAASWESLLLESSLFTVAVGILSEEAGLPLFPGDRLLVSLVRGRGAEFEMSLSPLCSMRASCLSLVNLVLGVSQQSERGGLVAQATEVHQTEPQHSVQGPSVHCLSLQFSRLCRLPTYPYSPHTTPLSRVYLLSVAYGRPQDLSSSHCV